MPLLMVPDTNVFLQFESFVVLPWKEIAGRDDVVVVVLAAVVRELDKLKLEPRLRDRVRDILPRLEALFADGDTATLQDGTPARFEHGIGVHKIMEEHGLESQLGDDRILAAALGLKEAGAEVMVVSDDTAVRLRARGLGVAVRAIPEKHRRISADPLQAENAKLRRELDEFRTAAPKLDVRFSEGGSLIRIARSKPPSGTRRLRDALQPLSLDSLPIIYQTELEKPTQAEVDAYNAKLEAFRPTYEEYVAERSAFELFPHQSIALELTIGNTGGKPAESVKLRLQLPDDVTVVEEDDAPTEPATPVRPKLPGRRRGLYAITEHFESVRDMMAPALAAESLYRIPEFRVASGPSNVGGPSFSPGELRFGVRLLSNFDEVALRRCFLRFPTPEAVRSFGIKYTLRSHSLPKLVEGELHFVVSEGEAGEGDSDQGAGDES